MNRLNKFVKSFLVASLSLAFLLPNAAITSNAAVEVGTQVSKYNVTDNTAFTSNALIETGTNSYILATPSTTDAYKVSVKSSSSNLKIFKRKTTIKNTSKSSNSKQSTVSTYVGDGSYDYDYDFTTTEVYGYAKKAGTYTIKYDIKDINGVKIYPTQTVTVVAKDNVSPFKKITYAGKSIWNNEDSRFSDLNDDTFYTTKKKGKLVVKAASGYKIKKIEVGSYNAVETSTTDTTSYTKESYGNKNNAKTSSGSYIYKYDEYGNTTNGTITYKKVKSGKKVALSTVPYTNSYSNYSYTSKSDTNYNNTSSYTNKICTPTFVRVTYYDKTTKKTFQWSTTIYYVK